jgi:hypothetical protein
MSVDEYKKAFSYEMLIRNVYECPRGMKNGADLCFMQNAMTMERGKSFAKNLGPFKKQFEVVKNYLQKALIKLSKTRKYNKSLSFFEQHLNNLSYVNTTSDLMEIVDTTLDELNKYKIEK